MKKYTVIGNWKSYFSYTQAIDWISAHHKDLAESIPKNVALGLCPSFESLAECNRILNNQNIMLGAQDCSTHPQGAYTGQVPASSLKEVGCRICIVGHSETREYLCQTNQAIAEKIDQLIAHSITPILCIGETFEERDAGQTERVLSKQMAHCAPVLQKIPLAYVAYEPIWAIGSGMSATPAIIQEALTCIKKNSDQAPIKLLYGGSVKAANIESFKDIPLLDGLLIGKASTAFAELRSILYAIKNWEN